MIVVLRCAAAASVGGERLATARLTPFEAHAALPA